MHLDFRVENKQAIVLRLQALAEAAALSIILEYFYIVAIEVVAQMKLGNYVIDFN